MKTEEELKTIAHLLIGGYKRILEHLSDDEAEVEKAAIACAIKDADNTSIAFQIAGWPEDHVQNWISIIMYLKTLE